MILLVVVGFLVAYGWFAAVRLGLHQRLVLALGPISLERIPDRAARAHGDRILFTSDTPCAWEVPALHAQYPDPTTWSAARIKATVGCLATLFQDRLGLQRGDRVAVLKENHLDIHIFVTSVVRAGGVGCPINGNFRTEDLGPYITNLGARILITDAPTLLRVLTGNGDFGAVTRIVVAERRNVAANIQHALLPGLLAGMHPSVELIWLEEALTDVRQQRAAVGRRKDEPLYLVHSSGTTGFPKAVILRNGPQSHAVRGWLCYVHVSRTRDKGYLAVPNNHQAVILSFNSLLLLGVAVHWAAAYGHRGFDAPGTVQKLADGRFTGFFGFPITYTQMKEVPLEKYDLRRMTFWASTADASHEAVQRRFVALGGAFRRVGLPLRGSAFLDAQGSSEVGTPSVLRYITPLTTKFGRRIGRPGSTPFGPRTRLVKTNGQLARPGEVGRLEVKGRTVFDGYWNNPALTSESIRDGWFFTGDVARRGKDGHLVQLDREVDVIRTRTGDVYSLPIEETIHKHPAIFDVCVYGERQDDGTQVPAAAVALREGFEIGSERLRGELNAALHDSEHLRRLDIMPWDEFPVGVTGKTLKRVFRERTELPSRRALHSSECAR